MQDVGRQGEKVEYLKPNGLVFYQVYKITTVTDLSAANFSAKKQMFLANQSVHYMSVISWLFFIKNVDLKL